MRRRILLGVVFVLASLFLGWTAATAGTRAQSGSYPDYYAQLTEGFLHGELSIPTPAPKGLTSLPDPYDPDANKPYRTPFGDLDLYKGHFYLDWGPTPVLTLYLPWHLLGFGAPSGNFADWIFSVVGLAFALLTLEAIVDRFLPAARPRWVAFVGVALAFETAVPFLDREPDNYEVSVACTYCFAMLGLFLLARSGLPKRFRPWMLAGASFCFGLAANSRQDSTLLGILLIPVLVSIWRYHRPADWRGVLGRFGPTLVPFGVLIALLGLYNFLRFGSPTQIGSIYQLAGFNPQLTPYYQLSYLLPSLYFYLVSPIHWTLYFPFFEIPPPIPPIGTPIAYQPQIIAGIASAAPILLMLVAAPFVLRKRLGGVLRTALIAMVVTGFALVSLISLSIPGGSERYVPDFSTLFLLPAGVCWLAWSPRPFIGRILVRGAGAIAIAYGAIVGIAVSITGYYNQIIATDPSFYTTMVNDTVGYSTFVTKLLNHPIVTAVNGPAGVVSNVKWDSFGVGTIIYMNFSGQPTQFSVIAPHSGTWELEGSVGPGPQYSAAGNSPIYLVVTDATGTHRYPYYAGTDYFAVHLSAGAQSFYVSAEAPHHKGLPATDSLLAASGVNFGIKPTTSS